MTRADESTIPKEAGVLIYKVIGKIGKGSYGEVCKAKHRVTGSIVAVKKVQYNVTRQTKVMTNREMRIMRRSKHNNVVKSVEVFLTPNDRHMYLVMEFCDYDLSRLLECKTLRFSTAEIKGVLRQLFDGLRYLHKSRVMHRDIKPSNILINKEGVLKIADFGMSRILKPSPAEDEPLLYTPGVTTICYRPPEVLLLQKNYSPAVDIWAAGCLMAEMWTRYPILQGENELHQLKLIVDLCGSITTETYPGAADIPWFGNVDLPMDEERRVTETLMDCVQDPDGMDLIEKLLTIDPVTRVDANTVLEHDFFRNQPLPWDLKYMVYRFRRSLAASSNRRNSHGLAL